MIVYEVDSEGFILGSYDSNFKFDANPDFLITKGWTERIFTPKFDFELNDWVEGLNETEIQAKESEIEAQGNRPSDEEINAIAIMELTQIVMGGK